MRNLKFLRFILLLALSVAARAAAAGDAEPLAGTLRGTVKLEANGQPLHKARVLIPSLGRSTETNEAGEFEFRNVPPGTYDVVVTSSGLSDVRRSATVKDGSPATLEFVMSIAPVREQVTVTASGREETVFESLQAATSLESIALVAKNQPALGDVLDGQPGVAKRSFGPGNSRPVLRGFDGDRVLVMQDGVASGTLASQSGDHGEEINPLELERIEIVRGPATLLYGSNAIGGVVNAISGHQLSHDHPHRGLSGFLSGGLGSANSYRGGSGGLEFGGKHFVVWAGGGGSRTGDYHTPLAEIVNSRTRGGFASGGAGWYSDRAWLSAGYSYDNRRYGIPFAAFLENGPPFDPHAEVVNLRLRKHSLLVNAGARALQGGVTAARFTLAYSHYRHGEFDGDSLETDFSNRLFTYRASFDHRRAGKLSGTFGFSGSHRRYRTEGAEALAPPVVQDAFALFALETLDFERVTLQFGGRFEHAGYETSSSMNFPAPPPDRDFNGLSAAAGIRVPLWKSGAFVANFTHSFRAPALEELYNFGPHAGNITFEIGNPALRREQGNGLDLSLRHQANRVRASANFFFYRLGDFVFLTPTGQIRGGLPEAEFLQGDSRYLGGEFTADVNLGRNIWLMGGFDAVRAELRSSIASTVTALVTPAGTPLPRIPPFRGRLGMDFRWKGLSVHPEGVFAAAQDEIFPTETRTAGYALFNLNLSYTFAGPHAVHVFAVNSFNLTDELYRNHLSFIKQLAPEIGRGVRVSYTLRFF
jgi:iron complex outermembrane receptor protein